MSGNINKQSSVGLEPDQSRSAGEHLRTWLLHNNGQLFTCKILAERLLEKQISVFGTKRAIRLEIPFLRNSLCTNQSFAAVLHSAWLYFRQCKINLVWFFHTARRAAWEGTEKKGLTGILRDSSLLNYNRHAVVPKLPAEDGNLTAFFSVLDLDRVNIRTKTVACSVRMNCKHNQAAIKGTKCKCPVCRQC